MVINSICSYTKLCVTKNLCDRVYVYPTSLWTNFRSFCCVLETPEGKKNNVPKKDTSTFPPKYIAKEVESEWYEWWESMGYFEPDPKKKKTFSIILPPPNVTGSLHLGHALTATIQDVLARWHRMQGKSVVWIPGMDHAGIATQVMVEKKLWKEKQLTRHDIGHDQFLDEIWKWTHHRADHIVQQLRKLGVTLSWSRELFTMDPKHSEAVTEAFIHLFDSGLIYRTDALVNWSCALQSAISDIEVEYRQFKGPTMCHVPGYKDPVEFGVLTHFAYKLCDTDGEVIVSTTRVETMLGDVAIAVNPRDPRYKYLQGAVALHPFTQRKLPIIFDEFVDQKVGTGAVKITPGHDPVDFDVAKRHDLEISSIFTEDGTLNEKCGQFTNLNRFEARKLVTSELEKLGLLRRKHDHEMHVPFCSRSGDVIEFLLKPQWFIKCKQMADEAAAAVQNSVLIIEPDVFEKEWYHWLYNIKDWCISRQLWWGHRVPAYECKVPGQEKSGIWVSASDIKQARRKIAAQLHLSNEEAENIVISQDSDVLDTWFSSALLPFTAFGWPDQSKDFQKFYPLSMMETGHDILFFWVARMVMLGTQLTCKLPFEKISLHGLVCDPYGRKMSKSLGNVVLPEDVINGTTLQDLHNQIHANYEAGLLSQAEVERAIEGQKRLFPKGIPECGVDALRFTLASQDIKGHYIRFNVAECYENRSFCNKVWQATKYVMMCLDKFPTASQGDVTISRESLRMFDRWILNRLAFMVSEVDKFLLNGDIHLAAHAVKTFIYNEFCDLYLESTKPPLKDVENVSAITICRILLLCLDNAVRCLSPFMPFLTEELYQRLPVSRSEDSITIAKFPRPEMFKSWREPSVEKDAQFVKDVIVMIRKLKVVCKTPTGKPTAFVVCKNNHEKDICEENSDVIRLIAGCDSVLILDNRPQKLEGSVIAATVNQTCCLYLSLQGEVDFQKEEAILNKKVTKLEEQLKVLIVRTNSVKYKENASEENKTKDFSKMAELEKELKEMNQLQNILTSRSNVITQD